MKKELEKLIEQFKGSQSFLSAIGDENRQLIILELIKKQQCENCKGMRVNCIARKTNLSRAATSRHLQILKDAGLVSVVRDGTMNYYFWKPDPDKLDVLKELVEKSAILPVSVKHFD